MDDHGGSPSPVYHNLTASPPQAFTDSRKNGYLLLLGFDASAEQDPLQAGYERKAEGSDLQAANACMLGDEGKGTTTGASANMVRGWFTSADPVAMLKPQAAAVRSWELKNRLPSGATNNGFRCHLKMSDTDKF